MNYNLFRKIHLWLAVPFGLVIFVCCISGALLILIGDNCGDFGKIVFSIHRWLLDVPSQRGVITSGKLIVGLSTIAFVILLMTGALLWLKRAKVNLAHSLAIRAHYGRYVFFESMHIVIGMYVMPIALLVSLTGLTWSFSEFRSFVYGLFEWVDPTTLRVIIRQVHTGTIFGVTTRALWCIVALACATLPITGYYIWIKRIIRQRNYKNIE